MRLTILSVVRLQVFEQLFLLHDFILSLVQLDPEDTNTVSLPPSTGEHMYSFNIYSFICFMNDNNSHLHVCIKFPLQV